MKNKLKLTLILILTSLMVTLGNLIIRNYSAAHLDVHFVDVGQGDCTLILCDNGQTILIDSGVEQMSDKLIGYISSLGINKLDYVVATHPDSDHIGAMDKVIEHFDVGYFSMPDFKSESGEYKELVKQISKKQISRLPMCSGDNFTVGNVKFLVLSPEKDKVYTDANSSSIVLKLNYQNVSMLFMADATMENEDYIVDSFDDIYCDVIKIGHHGSSTSTSEYFLKRVDPKFAVISCGLDNKYHHPSKPVMELLKKYEVGIFRTDRQGSIVLRVKDSKISSNKNPIYEYE